MYLLMTRREMTLYMHLLLVRTVRGTRVISIHKLCVSPLFTMLFRSPVIMKQQQRMPLACVSELLRLLRHHQVRTLVSLLDLPPSTLLLALGKLDPSLALAAADSHSSPAWRWRTYVQQNSVLRADVPTAVDGTPSH